jgi:hypothetical protein
MPPLDKPVSVKNLIHHFCPEPTLIKLLAMITIIAILAARHILPLSGMDAACRHGTRALSNTTAAPGSSVRPISAPPMIKAIPTTPCGGSTTDTNWSTSTNWDSGLPAGNDVVFAATDATGSTGPLGAANNIVNANTTVTSLKFTNIQPGNHTTRIPSGVTLTVNGSGTNIEVQSPTTGTDDVVYATILGDGKLTANNTAATLYVGQGSSSGSTIRRATLDLSGLGEFSATLNQLVIGRQLSGEPNRPQGTLKLAHTNALDLTANPGILLGNISSNNGSQILELGVSNSIRSNNGMTIGGRKGNGILRFNSGLVGPGEGTATFRNLAGTGRQSNWLIGDNSAQNGGTNAASGSVDFSVYGEVDALVGTIILGRANGSSSATGTPAPTAGTLSFDRGTINTNSLTAGIQPNAPVPGSARGTVNVHGNLRDRNRRHQSRKQLQHRRGCGCSPIDCADSIR